MAGVRIKGLLCFSYRLAGTRGTTVLEQGPESKWPFWMCVSFVPTVLLIFCCHVLLICVWIVCLSLCHSVWRSVFFVYLSMWLFDCMSFWLHAFLAVCLLDCMSFSLFVFFTACLFMCVCMSFYMCVCMSLLLYVFLSVCLFDCMSFLSFLSVSVYVFLTLCRFVCVSVCLL